MPTHTPDPFGSAAWNQAQFQADPTGSYFDPFMPSMLAPAPSLWGPGTYFDPGYATIPPMPTPTPSPASFQDWGPGTYFDPNVTPVTPQVVPPYQVIPPSVTPPAPSFQDWGPGTYFDPNVTPVTPQVVPPYQVIPPTTGFPVDWEQEFDPWEQFRQYAAQQFAPGRARQAFYGQQSPLIQRWMLGYGAPRAGVPSGQMMGGFLERYPGPQGQRTTEELRTLAEAANVIGRMTGGQFAEWAGDPAAYAGPGAGRITGMDPLGLQTVTYRDWYGGGQGAAQNQLAAAQMLALQRPGGGQYGGIVGEAVTGALSELYTNLLAQQGGEANFLNWYLERTRPEATSV